jgi:hypothetical protein
MLDWLRNSGWRKWWHPAIALGVIVAVIALAIKNRDIALFGLGIMVCAVAELMLNLYFRFNRQLGFALIGLGVLFMALGLYHLITS